MAICNCLPLFLLGKKKKTVKPLQDLFNEPNDQKLSPLEESYKSSNVRPTATELSGDAAYEGSDEHDEILSLRRDYSDFDFQAKVEPVSHASNSDLNNYTLNDKVESSEGVIAHDAIFARGHVSDPGMGLRASRLLPVLKRSCSNIEIKRSNELMNLLLKRSSSYSELKSLNQNDAWIFINENQSSPLSIKTSFSADHMIVKKRSLCQILPSQSRKIWWKLILWSHRNAHGPAFPLSNDSQKPDKQKKLMEFDHYSHFAPFSYDSSPQDRVFAWVSSLEDMSFCSIDEEAGVGSNHVNIKDPSVKNHFQFARCSSEESLQACNIIQSINSFSSAAHISGMGLKVIPSISAFGSLRSVSLRGNFIAHITPGCLPKHIHILDLSRNKISIIEGLRDLTRLRVLNLSYNRITRIGHGLSNCTVIKELNLAGNRIGEVDGLHRLLKLTVLDLGFNKITTTKSFGQLVANYNSLSSLNLTGNPILSNAGEDQIRKAALSLLPRITHFNKQPIKQHRSREAAVSITAKVAAGDGGWSSQRRPTRRVAGGSARGRTREGSFKGKRNQHPTFVRK